MSSANDIASRARARVASIDRGALARDLDAGGYAVLPGLLTPRDCKRVRAMYARDVLFRTRIVMARHGFGLGEYKYFSYPLPSPLLELRGALYEALVPIANRWHEAFVLREFERKNRSALR